MFLIDLQSIKGHIIWESMQQVNSTEKDRNTSLIEIVLKAHIVK